METISNIYTIPLARPIEDSARTIFAGIQGPPGSGKTTAALTFPNPVLTRFEKSDIKGLLELPHLKGVVPQSVPFYDLEYIKDTLKTPLTKGGLVNKPEALSKWLRTDGQKLTESQTLVLDSWTTFQDAVDDIIFHQSEAVYSKSGAEDFFAPWDRKITISTEIITLLGGLKCNVVVLFHEVQERDKETGRILDKRQPLQQGKFITKLKIYFPYFFRQICRSIKKPDGTPGEPEYVWQVKSTDDFDAKYIGKPDRPMFIKADYKSLL